MLKKTPTSRHRETILKIFDGSLTHSLKRAAEILDMSERSLYNEIADGKIQSIKVRNRRKVTSPAIIEYLESLEAAEG